MRRLALYEPAGDSLVLARMIPLDVGPEGLCMTGSMLAVYGRTAAGPENIYLIDTTGTRIRAFGEVYRGAHPIIRHAMSDGRIACAPTGAIVVTTLNDVRSYGTDGSFRWVTTFGDFIHAGAEEMPGGGYRSFHPPGGYHIQRALIALPNGDVLVQVGFSTLERIRNGELISLTTAVLDGASGAVKGLFNDAPPISLMTPTAIASVEHSPFPKVRLLRRR
jgi:hypothetical protein